MGEAHQIKPHFCPPIAATPAGIFPDPAGQPIRLPVNNLQDSVRDLLRPGCLNSKAQLIYLKDAPHFQTVRHILYGTFHTAAGGS